MTGRPAPVGGGSAPTAEDGAAAARAVVTRLWAVAVLVHLLGNPALAFGSALPSPAAVPTLVAAVLAGAVALRPADRRLLAGLVVAVVAIGVLRLPVLANNLVLTAVLGAALLVRRDDVAVAGVRRVGTAAYAFAAFAKLNTDFLDPGVSCGPVLLERLLAGVGLPLPPDPVVAVVPVGAVLVEVAVAVGLLVPATRRHAALLGVLFHGLLAFDLLQHFWDFTTALLPLFAAASPAVAVGLAGGAARVVPRRVAVAALGVLVVGGLVSALPVAPATGLLLGHLTWATAGTAVVAGWVLVHRRVERSRDPAPAARVHVAWTPAVGVLVAAVVLNGLAPYVQLKSGWSWNMYANLRVVGEQSNHLVVPPADLRGDHDELVVLTASSDESLDRYVDDERVVPLVQVTDWVARSPGARVTVVPVPVPVDGAEHAVVADEPVVLVHGEVEPSRPAWVVRLLPLRPTDPTCLLSYGPLG